MGIAKLTSYFSSQVNKHNLHIIKAKEYINKNITQFSKASTDNIITSDKCIAMNNLQNQYFLERLQIFESNSYITTNGSVAQTSTNVV